jgi:hypothetical protein
MRLIEDPMLDPNRKKPISGARKEQFEGKTSLLHGYSVDVIS